MKNRGEITGERFEQNVNRAIAIMQQQLVRDVTGGMLIGCERHFLSQCDLLRLGELSGSRVCGCDTPPVTPLTLTFLHLGKT